MKEYLSSKQFFDITRNVKRRTPKEIKLPKRSSTEITLIWGWAETIQRSSVRSSKEFKQADSKFAKQIKKLRITEKELLSLLAIRDLHVKNPDDMHRKPDDELYPKN